MHSLLSILLISSSLFFIVFAESQPSTYQPKDESTPPPAVKDAESTPAPAEKDSTSAPVESEKATAAPVKEEPKKDEVSSTVPPKEDAAKENGTGSSAAPVKAKAEKEEEEEEDEDEEVSTSVPVQKVNESTPAPAEKATDSTPAVTVNDATSAPKENDEVISSAAPIKQAPKEEVQSTESPKEEKKDAESTTVSAVKVEKEEEEEDEEEEEEESTSVLIDEIKEIGLPVEKIEELKEVKIAVPTQVKTEISEGEPTKEAKDEKFVKKFVRPATGSGKLFGELFKSSLEKLRSGKPATISRTDFAKIKPSFDKLRAGRGLINIERIDKIDVTVHVYPKKK